MKYEYEIDGKKYTQSAIVLGQLAQLTAALKGLDLPAEVSPSALISALSERLPRLIAIVLAPEGVALRDRDLDAMTAEVENCMSPELALQVVEDFFVCNPVASLLERLRGTVGLLASRISPTTGSRASSASSPAGTSPSGTPSSGAIH